jgi:hypothetical protein
LEEAGFNYNDCWTGPPVAGRPVFEAFPYTTLVGAEELGTTLSARAASASPKHSAPQLGVPFAPPPAINCYAASSDWLTQIRL